MISKIFKLLFIPVLGLVISGIFFVIVVTPAQRNIIIEEILSQLPIAKNFVTKRYKTQVYGLEFEDAKDLKTASWSIDQLIRIEKKDSQGKIQNYMALYPYTLEAGFNLGKVNIEENQNKLTMRMPAPKLINVDVNEKKNLKIIRDSLEGHYDEILQPVKIAYQNIVKDIGRRSNLFENAKDSAKKYFSEFWKKQYENVDIQFTNKNESFTILETKQLPLKFTVNNEFLNNNKVYDHTYGKCNIEFASNKGSIFSGYSQVYYGSNRDLYHKMREYIDNHTLCITYTDPLNPNSGSWTGLMQPSGYFVGLKLHNGKLYNLLGSPADKQAAKSVFADSIYLMSNMHFNANKEADTKYEKFVNLIDKARSEGLKKKFGTLLHISKRLNQINRDSSFSKLAYNFALTLEDKSFYSTDNSNIDTQLKAYLSAINNTFSENERSNFYNSLIGEKEKDIYNKYIYSHANVFGLSQQDKKQALTHIIENSLISKKLIMSMSKNDLKLLIEEWIEKKTEEFFNTYYENGAKDKYWARALHSDIDAEGVRIYGPTGHPFYDTQALSDIHSKGKKNVYKWINRVIESPEKRCVVVLTREKYAGLSEEYDAFVFFHKGFLLIKDIEKGNFHKEDDSFEIYYKDLNPGTDQIIIAEDEYKNATLYYLLNELHKTFAQQKYANIDKEFSNMALNIALWEFEWKLMYPKLSTLDKIF